MEVAKEKERTEEEEKKKLEREKSDEERGKGKELGGGCGGGRNLGAIDRKGERGEGGGGMVFEGKTRRMCIWGN